MKKIEIFVGSDSAFEKIVPKSARNLSEMAAKLDDGNKKMDVFVNIPGQPEPKSKKKKKPRVQDFIIHADEYCSVQEHVIINFINFIFQMSITNMYIQNPPKNIREQIYRTFDKSIIHETQASKVKYGGDKPVYKRYELKNKILIPFPHNGRQEYTELMKIVYRFALGDADEYELVIGNIMRQVLEAFSTFQYKKGIEEVSTDRSILAILPEKEYQSYFENLMYRLILNNGSHRLDQTRSMSDMNFFTVISDSEKKRTAKEILCFIYLLNEKHVLAHLDGCSNVQSNLSKWCNDVKNKVGA